MWGVPQVDSATSNENIRRQFSQTFHYKCKYFKSNFIWGVPQHYSVHEQFRNCTDADFHAVDGKI